MPALEAKMRESLSNFADYFKLRRYDVVRKKLTQAKQRLENEKVELMTLEVGTVNHSPNNVSAGG